eukprot:m51a1_g11086 hypothetical protein (355) ;mRNA; r:7587-8807
MSAADAERTELLKQIAQIESHIAELAAQSAKSRARIAEANARAEEYRTREAEANARAEEARRKTQRYLILLGDKLPEQVPFAHAPRRGLAGPVPCLITGNFGERHHLGQQARYSELCAEARRLVEEQGCRWVDRGGMLYYLRSEHTTLALCPRLHRELHSGEAVFAADTPRPPRATDAWDVLFQRGEQRTRITGVPRFVADLMLLNTAGCVAEPTEADASGASWLDGAGRRRKRSPSSLRALSEGHPRKRQRRSSCWHSDSDERSGGSGTALGSAPPAFAPAEDDEDEGSDDLYDEAMDEYRREYGSLLPANEGGGARLTSDRLCRNGRSDPLLRVLSFVEQIGSPKPADEGEL